MNTHIKVDEYIQKAKLWQEETKALRNILLTFPIVEDFKWGKPCYTVNNSNVVIIQGFKNYIGLMFFKGTLMSDPKQVLVSPGENSQAGRQLRFTSKAEITAAEDLIVAYIDEALDIEKSGRKVEFKERESLIYPDELSQIFREEPDFQIAFESLTPGRQRQYIMFFTGAKQSATKVARIEKYKDHIFARKGMNDN